MSDPTALEVVRNAQERHHRGDPTLGPTQLSYALHVAERALAEADKQATVSPGLRLAVIAEDVLVNEFGEPLCASCKHGHTEAAWSDRDPDDGTCWNAGSLVCGCPKFITPSVQAMRIARRGKATSG